MDVTFQTGKLEKTVMDGKLLTRKYGPELARKIAQRYEELRAAECLQDMPPAAGTHPLHNDREGEYGLTLKQPYRMIIRPVGNFDPVNLATIQEIQVVEIIDYH